MSQQRSIKLTLPAGYHHNPNCLPIKETKISLLEAVYGIARNKIAAHGDSEAYSSLKLVRHSLTFRMIINFPV